MSPWSKGRRTPRTGVWGTETLRRRLPELINPFDEDRIEGVGYELALGDQVFVTGWDVRRQLDYDEQVSIPPGQFGMLLTAERVSVPPDALALISIKSRYKLPGLINVSGFHVDPGWDGHLKFSIFNAGSTPIPLTRGAPVFIIWYLALDAPTPTDALYDGSRQGTTQITDSDVKDLTGPVHNPQTLDRRLAALERLNTESRLATLETGINEIKESRVTRRMWIVTIVGTIIATIVGTLAVTSGGDERGPGPMPVVTQTPETAPSDPAGSAEATDPEN